MNFISSMAPARQGLWSVRLDRLAPRQDEGRQTLLGHESKCERDCSALPLAAANILVCEL